MNRRIAAAIFCVTSFLFSPVASAGPKVDTSDTYQKQLKYVSRYTAKDQAKRILHGAYKASKKTKVSVRWILAIVTQESKFKQTARSPDGSEGLMQVRTRVHRKLISRLGVRHILNLDGNMLVGSSIFASYLQKARGNTRRALKFYSGGSDTYSKSVIHIYNAIPA